MTAACSHGVTAESWIDFFTGELDEEAGERLEQLLFECAHCAAEAARWGTVIGGVEIAIPPVLSTKALLGTTRGILSLRGTWSQYHPNNDMTIPALPTLHPAYLLRNPAQKKLSWLDFLSLRAHLDQSDGTATD